MIFKIGKNQIYLYYTKQFPFRYRLSIDFDAKRDFQTYAHILVKFEK